jgi:hypothetical protein
MTESEVRDPNDCAALFLLASDLTRISGFGFRRFTCHRADFARRRATLAGAQIAQSDF